MDTDGKFYLGRIFDPKTNKLSGEPLLYDPADLTTHAVVVGMTGSGKTGLCIDLLEEAALNGIPALMIDPKGDITNLLLHFPELLPQDFQPWVNPDAGAARGQEPGAGRGRHCRRLAKRPGGVGHYGRSASAPSRTLLILPSTHPAPIRACRSASWPRSRSPEHPLGETTARSCARRSPAR